MNKDEIKLIMGYGKAHYIIQSLLDDEIFNDLSKHNEYFYHSDEIVSDKLRDLRIKFRKIEDSLNEILVLISVQENEEVY
jgi:hypothetical protein